MFSNVPAEDAYIRIEHEVEKKAIPVSDLASLWGGDVDLPVPYSKNRKSNLKSEDSVKAIQYLMDCLARAGLHVHKERVGALVAVSSDDDPRPTEEASPRIADSAGGHKMDSSDVLVVITVPFALLVQEAERIELRKPLLIAGAGLDPDTAKVNPALSKVSLRSFQDFKAELEGTADSVLARKTVVTAPVLASQLHLFVNGREPDLFFTPAERSSLSLSIIERVPLAQSPPQHPGRVRSGSAAASTRAVPPTLIEFYRQKKWLETVIPLHHRMPRKALAAQFKQSYWNMDYPLQQLRDYTGDSVAFYFGFLDFYIQWLKLPGLLGLAIVLHQYLATSAWEKDNATGAMGNNPYLAFYSLFIALWASLFLKFWRRRCAAYSFDWGTLHVDAFEPARRAFYGTPRLSPITGQLEPMYPTWKRAGKVLVSTLVTLAMLSVAMTVMFASLNLQGYILDPNSFGHVVFLQRYAAPGAIFDQNGWFFLVPTVIHAIVIFCINRLYRLVAMRLTDWENWRLQSQHENALIVKRFLFEAADCYLPLFYICFYRRNVRQLEIELQTLYMTDEVRRIATETLIPWLIRKFALQARRKSVVKQAGARKKNDDLRSPDDVSSSPSPSPSHTHHARTNTPLPSSMFSAGGETDLLSPAQKDEMLDEYEAFDDYLEMVIQFGYITLFAAAFPLAACLSIVSNVVEARSDIFRLLHLCRRVTPERANGIGSWYQVLQSIALVSVLTNCLIFGFESHQMAYWFPWLFRSAAVSASGSVLDELSVGDASIMGVGAGVTTSAVLQENSGHIVAGIVFGLEHVILLVIAAVNLLISDLPAHVALSEERRKYWAERAAASPAPASSSTSSQ